jgi:nucleoside-diphosphate-sugar epimerase
MPTIVTGAGGFVGRKLVELLLARGGDVVAVDTSLGHLGSRSGLAVVEGNIADREVLEHAFAHGCNELVHLATVPGGAAEADPEASWRINIEASKALFERAAAVGTRPRVVFASSIAILGDTLPAEGVSDATPLSPHMIYGGHKAMMEVALAMMSNRQSVEGVSLRLPGILARPKGLSGMKSAFMSDIFHALRAGNPFTCPVSQEATIWAQSITRCATNFIHALEVAPQLLPSTRALTLPALRFSMGELAAEIAWQAGTDAGLVSYGADAALEKAFGSYPPLTTTAGDAAGFRHDGALPELVRVALARIEEEAP